MGDEDEIDLTSEVSLTRQLSDVLRRRIADGSLPAGQRMPSESALTERYGVSRVTVRRALDVLRREGLIRSAQGRGWFVAPPQREP